MSTFVLSAKAYIRFALQLRGYLRETVTIDEIKKHILQRVVNREENFIELLKTNVFEYPRSPYLALFGEAKITHGDVERMVAQDGLESALEELCAANIYVTFEEYKGRVPIRRGNVELQLDTCSFDNLNLAPIFFAQSGGSSGKATRTIMDLEHIEEMAKMYALARFIHGVFDAPMLIWWGLLPDTMGVGSVLHRAHTGNTVQRWFSAIQGNDANLGWYYTVMTYLMINMSRIQGFKFPFPEYVSLDNPLPIARALADTVQDMGSALFGSTVSKCARVSIVAQKQSIDLTGVTFYGMSEPSTPAKVAAIEATGAKYVNQYGGADMGMIGVSCCNRTDISDVHLIGNNIALIQRPKKILDQIVHPFYFTSLLPSSPKMFINVQSDDFGIIEERDCGCPLHQMGFTKHIRQIGSHTKLTGEGVTLVGSDMVHILEHVLPSKFGGSLLDYQLVEEEDSQGFTKLLLYVDPSVPIKDNDVLSRGVLDAMKSSVPSARLAQAEFRTGNVVMVRREKPLVSSSGKFFPIRTLKVIH